MEEEYRELTSFLNFLILCSSVSCTPRPCSELFFFWLFFWIACRYVMNKKNKPRLYLLSPQSNENEGTSGPIKATRFIYCQKLRNPCVWDYHVTPSLCQYIEKKMWLHERRSRTDWWFNEWSNYCNLRIHLTPCSGASLKHASQKSQLVPQLWNLTDLLTLH